MKWIADVKQAEKKEVRNSIEIWAELHHRNGGNLNWNADVSDVKKKVKKVKFQIPWIIDLKKGKFISWSRNMQNTCKNNIKHTRSI